ncbi:MAG: phytanoyl-CoA dioxygenase family protein [Opitutales bacterium]|nr:phytanoyl-CoA dioxygenase family protein [Opitutales bacterium]
MILKPAGHGAATPWHQDQAYHAPGQHYRNINFWLPLEGATVAGGTMQYVSKTHTGTLLPHRYLIPGDRQSAMVADNQDFWSANATALDCPVGSVLLHHSYCMHYAGPNLTDIPRRAYIAVFAAPALPLDEPYVLPWQKNPKWPN